MEQALAAPPAARHDTQPAAADQMAALSRACAALWTANLSLMTAFMQTRAPAHRYLMARKIARNFTTLADQPCFTPRSRESFARLAARWTVKADRLSSHGGQPRDGGFGMLASLLASLFGGKGQAR